MLSYCVSKPLHGPAASLLLNGLLLECGAEKLEAATLLMGQEHAKR